MSNFPHYTGRDKSYNNNILRDCYCMKQQLVYWNPFFFPARQPPVNQGFLVYKVSRSHTTKHHGQ
jgi:hypothetical protein